MTFKPFTVMCIVDWWQGHSWGPQQYEYVTVVGIQKIDEINFYVIKEYCRGNTTKEPAYVAGAFISPDRIDYDKLLRDELDSIGITVSDK